MEGLIMPIIENRLPILRPRTMTRRELIFHAGAGFSGLALTALLDRDDLLAAELQRKRANPLAAKPPMFPAKAKSVIFLFMYGGVSHVDTFDPKPDLTRHHGKPMNKGKVDVFFGNPGNLMASPYIKRKITDLALAGNIGGLAARGLARFR